MMDYMINNLQAFIFECGRTQGILQSDNEDTLNALLKATAAKVGTMSVRHSPSYSSNSQGSVERLHRLNWQLFMFLKIFLHLAFFQVFAGICCSIYVAEVDFREVNCLGFKLFFGGKGGGQDGTIIMRLCAHCCERLDSCSIVFRWLLAFGESERNYLFSSRLLFEGSVACPAPRCVCLRGFGGLPRPAPLNKSFSLVLAACPIQQ